MTQRRTIFSEGTPIRNDSRGTIVASDPAVAATFFSRGRGLMMRSEFPEGSALVIDPCSSIHMFFMRFPIDVLYLNDADEVVRVQHGIRPWRVGPLFTRGARYVIELPAGAAERSKTTVGDRLVSG